MSRRVSISMDSRNWTALLEHLDRYGHEASTPCGRVREGLRRAMEPKRKRPQAHAVTKVVIRSKLRPSKEEKREETASIWEACWKRCANLVRGYHVCECGCERPVIRDTTDLNAKAELEHPFSKGKGARLPQSVETCWILRADCHRDRHAARPNAETWWKKFIAHCRHQFTADGLASNAWMSALEAARARLRFVETRASLPAAPRTGP